MTSVKVVTGARLHFGLLCGAAGSSGNFGGIGMMLQAPAWHIVVTPSDRFVVTGATESVHDRLLTLLPDVARMAGHSGLRVDVRESVPPHTGLGAGTQLTLAVATAALVAAGKPRPARASDLAEPLHRARRSAVGTHGFDRGGFLMDDGLSEDSAERTVHRLEFPENWRMVLVSSSDGEGLSGPEEEAVFDRELRMPDAVMNGLRRLVADDILPALAGADFGRFRDALFRYGRGVGEFFSDQQGGVFSSPVIRELCEQPEIRDGGPVQSSWGPTIAIPAESQAEAEQLIGRIQNSSASATIRCMITTARNVGATVTSVAPDDIGGDLRV